MVYWQLVYLLNLLERLFLVLTLVNLRLDFAEKASENEVIFSTVIERC